MHLEQNGQASSTGMKYAQYAIGHLGHLVAERCSGNVNCISKGKQLWLLLIILVK